MTAATTAADPAVERWTAVLDDYEGRLEAIRDATAAGTPSAIPPFLPPAGLGPMPDPVVPRARDLLLRSRELERTIVQAQQAIRTRLDAKPDTGPVRRSRLDVSL